MSETEVVFDKDEAPGPDPAVEDGTNDSPGVTGDNGTESGNRTRGEEVAQRTADTDEESTDTYRKKFLVGAPYREDEEFTDEFHEANAAQVAESAIHAGLRVIGDIKFVGHEPSGNWGHAIKADGTPVEHSTLVTYEAKAVPAHLVGAGPTPETSDVAATQDQVVSPRDVLTGGRHADNDDDEADPGDANQEATE